LQSLSEKNSANEFTGASIKRGCKLCSKVLSVQEGEDQGLSALEGQG
jgi:hypothetical protein